MVPTIVQDPALHLVCRPRKPCSPTVQNKKKKAMMSTPTFPTPSYSIGCKSSRFIRPASSPYPATNSPPFLPSLSRTHLFLARNTMPASGPDRPYNSSAGAPRITANSLRDRPTIEHRRGHGLPLTDPSTSPRSLKLATAAVSACPTSISKSSNGKLAQRPPAFSSAKLRKGNWLSQQL